MKKILYPIGFLILIGSFMQLSRGRYVTGILFIVFALFVLYYPTMVAQTVKRSENTVDKSVPPVDLTSDTASTKRSAQETQTEEQDSQKK